MSETASVSEQRVVLKNVRLSFPALFRKAKFKGEETKFEATLLIPKDDKVNLRKINKLIEAAKAEAKGKIKADKICLKDGDESDYDGYEGHMSFKAANNKRPQVMDRDKTPLTEEDGVVYAGCYVNASVGVWVQDNDYGKRINGNLYGIQFVKDGEPFGSGAVDVTDDFDDLGDDEDDEDDDDL